MQHDYAGKHEETISVVITTSSFLFFRYKDRKRPKRTCTVSPVFGTTQAFSNAFSISRYPFIGLQV